MTRTTTLLVCMSAVLLFMFTIAEFAEARRMGGGRSFGKKQSYSDSYKKPTAPDKPSQGQQQQPGGAPGAPAKPSRFGGLGGMMGGLLMGGLLGSMLFGGGAGGFGILEMLLVGGGLFLLFKLLRSRRAATAAAGAGIGPSTRSYASMGAEPSRAAGGWSNLATPPPSPGHAAPAAGPRLPEGFDAEEFLQGAKAMYTRLQASWDKRDLEDIRGFAAPEVFEELARQAAEDPGPGQTVILTLEARVLEVETEAGETTATVLYDALLREDSRNKAPEQVREVWRFSRGESTPNPQWKLSGIQQLEN